MSDSRKITVEVTEDDIRLGRKADNKCCPIALALRRQFPDAANLYVLYSVAYLQRALDGKYQTILLPDEAVDFISDFDFTTEKPKPLTFKATVRTLKGKSR